MVFLLFLVFTSFTNVSIILSFLPLFPTCGYFLYTDYTIYIIFLGIDYSGFLHMKKTLYFNTNKILASSSVIYNYKYLSISLALFNIYLLLGPYISGLTQSFARTSSIVSPIFSYNISRCLISSYEIYGFEGYLSNTLLSS